MCYRPAFTIYLRQIIKKGEVIITAWDTSWGNQSDVRVILDRIKDDLELLKSAGIAVPADHVHTRQVKVATTEAITLSGLQTLDGVSLSNNDLVLVKNQSDKTENGIYFAKSTAWVRDGFELFTDVKEGTENAGTTWLLQSEDTVVLGTSELQYNLLTAFTLSEMQAMISDLNNTANQITGQVSIVGNLSQAASISANDAHGFANTAHGYLQDTEIWAGYAGSYANQGGLFANLAQAHEQVAYDYMGNTATYATQAFNSADEAKSWANQAAGSSGIPTGGNIGQVFGIDSNGTKTWIDQSGGSSFFALIDGWIVLTDDPTTSQTFEVNADNYVVFKEG